MNKKTIFMTRTRLGQWMINRLNKKIFKKIKPYLKDQDRILEIGAGNGEMAQLFIEAGYDYYAIDQNLYILNKLSHLGTMGVSQQLVPPIKSKSRIYDFVFMQHLLEHMATHKETIELIKEIWRVLMPDGLVCIISPDYNHSHKWFFDCTYDHGYITTENRVKILLIDHGFEIIYSNSNYVVNRFWSTIGWLYNNWLFPIVRFLTKRWINPIQMGKTRGAVARCIFIIARKIND